MEAGEVGFELPNVLYPNREVTELVMLFVRGRKLLFLPPAQVERWSLNCFRLFRFPTSSKY